MSQNPADRNPFYPAASDNTYGYGQQYPDPRFIAPPPPAPVNPERNGLGIAAVICGPIGIFLCLTGFTGWLGFILGVIGFILAIAGLARVSRNKATNKWTAVTGLITSILAIFFGAIVTVMFFTAVDELGNDLDCISNATTSAQIDACN